MYAVVTGGSRGIGLAVVRQLVAEGWHCLVLARTKTPEIEKMEGEGTVRFLPCDISSAEDRSAFSAFLQTVEKADLLVNCAGVAPKIRHDMLAMTEEEFDYVLDINQKGTFFISQIAANKMKEQKSGRIVFISSLSSYTASPERAQYCISKASISMFTKLFAARMAEYGVSVFEVSPGVIETDMTACVKEKYERMIRDGLTPVPRMGQPADVAEAVCAAASGKLDFCTGSVLYADGGFSVRRL